MFTFSFSRRFISPFSFLLLVKKENVERGRKDDEPFLTGRGSAKKSIHAHHDRADLLRAKNKRYKSPLIDDETTCLHTFVQMMRKWTYSSTLI